MTRREALAALVAAPAAALGLRAGAPRLAFRRDAFEVAMAPLNWYELESLYRFREDAFRADVAVSFKPLRYERVEFKVIRPDLAARVNA